MELAKAAIDVGLATNREAKHLAFWRDTVGLALESRLEISPSQVQYRFDANGSVVKVNCFDDALPGGARTGYREVLIAREGLREPLTLDGPDGCLVRLVPPGHEGVTQVGVRVAVRDLTRQHRFYSNALGLAADAGGNLRIGASLLVVAEDASAGHDPGATGTGWRYLTLQVRDAAAVHARALRHGAYEARPLTRLGDVALFSILRDPDGNAVEISQRASLVHLPRGQDRPAAG